jgi:general secretion pathway protein H
MHRQHGLTLLELLVVLAIIGFAMAGVSLSLRDSRQTQLEREAQRLVALLEAARAQSRTSGVALIWQSTPEGFVIRPAQPQVQVLGNGLQATASTNTSTPLAPRAESWLTAGTQAAIHSSDIPANNTAPVNAIVLGPEPILTPARITLSMPTPQGAANSAPIRASLRVGTDGLRPFQVLP